MRTQQEMEMSDLRIIKPPFVDSFCSILRGAPAVWSRRAPPCYIEAKLKRNPCSVPFQANCAGMVLFGVGMISPRKRRA